MFWNDPQAPAIFAGTLFTFESGKREEPLYPSSTDFPRIIVYTNCVFKKNVRLFCKDQVVEQISLELDSGIFLVETTNGDLDDEIPLWEAILS
uniref:Uncharacterized protein n=1 Tax=Marseillevirus LCMAC201 TaxID=2506605 RepID=A0A481YWG6_9VIRU|nr:MAG: hypothetical protein LCMAC201_01190 [Marseillevirus LCMAC201]